MSNLKADRQVSACSRGSASQCYLNYICPETTWTALSVSSMNSSSVQVSEHAGRIRKCNIFKGI